tara:strand:+ start:363 stop:1079 length:717 start_codon:yes stop_codon:yes gene_type:complete
MTKQRRTRKQKERSDIPASVVDSQVKARPVINIEPMNEKQKDCYIDLLSTPCVILMGSAGTGKTYLAASVAAKDLAERRIGRIILSRANVGTGKSLGAFPGTVEDKMAPWLLPITDVLKAQLGAGFYAHAVKSGDIVIQPLETIRGRSFDDAVVLMDESQQLTIEELKAVTTRIGRNAKLFLMGDRSQRDVRTDGLGWLLKLVQKHDLPVGLHEFTSDDIVRSGLCRAFVQAFEKEDS